MIANSFADLNSQIHELISLLHNSDGLVRQKARLELIMIGWEAVPALIDVVENQRGQARWEAIEALGRAHASDAADVLVEALQDEDMGIRWAASNALIELDRAGIKPLLAALTQNFQSVWLREGAHHVLHVLKDRRRLLAKEIKVFDALEGVEPETEVPWAAESALEDLLHNQMKRNFQSEIIKIG